MSWQLLSKRCLPCPVDPFCLGLCSWYACPENAEMATSRPHPKHEPLLHPSGTSTSSSVFAAINASEPHLSSVGRFAFVSDQEIAKLSEGLVLQNTAKVTSWATKNFRDWMTNRNQRNPADPVPSDIFGLL